MDGTRISGPGAKTWDAAVVGGGLIGGAIAYGLARQGLSVVMLDEGDVAFRAARGNFGLVWVQSKGNGMSDYAVWTRHSADLWPEFAGALEQDSGVAPDFFQPGGLHFMFSEEEMEMRRAMLMRLHNVAGIADYGAEMLDRETVLKMVPGLGPEVVGASYCRHDGHASPLRTLRGLHAAIARMGGSYLSEHRVSDIAHGPQGFRLTAGDQVIHADRVVLAAGLGNRELGPMVGLDVPVTPLKGQIMVTERAAPMLDMPTHVIRQTAEGSMMMGDSHEDEGFEISSKTGVMGEIAARAMRTLPGLGRLNVVRSWAALRVMTPDGFPLYQQSERCPGAFSVNCHSGVTLAGAHALALAPMIAAGTLSPQVSAFSGERFHVHQDG